MDWQSLGERDYLFPSRVHALPHLSTRQYGRIVERWVSSIGLDPKRYGTHSMRRTKAAHIYKKTGNLRASSCSATKSWRATYSISASRSTTRSPSLNKLNCTTELRCFSSKRRSLPRRGPESTQSRRSPVAPVMSGIGQ